MHSSRHTHDQRTWPRWNDLEAIAEAADLLAMPRHLACQHLPYDHSEGPNVSRRGDAAGLGLQDLGGRPLKCPRSVQPGRPNQYYVAGRTVAGGVLTRAVCRRSVYSCPRPGTGTARSPPPFCAEGPATVSDPVASFGGNCRRSCQHLGPAAVVQQHVLRLHVSVHDAVLPVQCPQPLGSVEQDLIAACVGPAGMRRARG